QTLPEETLPEETVPEETIPEETIPTRSDTEVTVTASGTCGDNLTWELTSDGTLTISGTGEMSNYNSFYASMQPPWSNYRSKIINVVVENGVT
ncbi:hypothetical protein, partial [Klebsiella pneumoniae]|uniref:hypothetical protein n=1 Tax=Klebsiella pneumoniae TaxID=573 RepID=UPI0025A1899D